MKKCDFCIYSQPDGKCYWTLQAYRVLYCKIAIKQMTKALRGDRHDIKSI